MRISPTQHSLGTTVLSKRLVPGLSSLRYTASTLSASAGVLRSPAPVRHYSVAQQSEDFATASSDSEEPPFKPVVWDRNLTNAVSLIGRLGKEFELKQVNGTPLATNTLAVTTSKEKSEWFRVEIWGRLAPETHVLRKGEQVHVVGSLRAAERTTREGVRTTYFSVRVQNLNRVLPGQPNQQASQDWHQETPAHPQQSQRFQQPQQPEPFDLMQEDQTAGREDWGSPPPPPPPRQTYGNTRRQAAAPLWEALMKDRSQWWDNRLTKKNPKQPDFKHKKTEEALWLNTAPEHVRKQLDAD